MADINLLQTQQSISPGFSNRSRVFLSRLLMFVLIVIVLAFAFLKFSAWQTNKQIAKAEASIQSAQSEAINNKDRQELITRQGQTKELDTLVSNHLYWSYLLPELARVTTRSAKYTNINILNDGKLGVTVILPSFDELEKYLQVFDLPEYNQQFSNVKVISIGRTQADGALQTSVRIELTYNPTFLKGRN